MYQDNQESDLSPANSWIEQAEFRCTRAERGKQLAVVDLLLGSLVIKGFKVLLSKFVSSSETNENLWVDPPSLVLSGGQRSRKLIYVEDVAGWKMLEQKIISEYQRQLGAQSTSSVAVEQEDDVYAPPTEEIDVSTVPF